MSEFAFLTIPFSIVIRLGVTHILHGLGRILHKETPWGWRGETVGCSAI